MGFFAKKGKFENWKLVYTTNMNMEAEHYKANLEGAGIPVQILSQFDSSRMLTVGDFAIVKIFVPEEYYEDAKQIIDDINKNQDGIDENRID
jgi:hypothetical protein